MRACVCACVCLHFSPLALESSGKEAAARQFSLGNQHEVAMMTNSASSDGVASALATFDDVIESALESVEDEQSEPSQKLEVQVSTPRRLLGFFNPSSFPPPPPGPDSNLNLFTLF